MYPNNGDCTQSNIGTCCSYDFSADAVGTGSGTVEFYSLWDLESLQMSVPPENNGENLSFPECGPVIGIWWSADHSSTGVTGGYEQTCSNLGGDYGFCGSYPYHGIVLSSNDSWCYLNY
jgi:hypothetical protein